MIPEGLKNEWKMSRLIAENPRESCRGLACFCCVIDNAILSVYSSLSINLECRTGLRGLAVSPVPGAYSFLMSWLGVEGYL